MKLLTSNKKLDKALPQYLNMGVSFAEGNKSGHEVCLWRGECFEPCVNSSGMNKFKVSQDAKIERTKLFFENYDLFCELLRKELKAALKKAKRLGKTLAIRLNVGSDLLWEKCSPWVFTEFPEVIFYDYTKALYRIRPSKSLPSNYKLTYSVNEKTPDNEIKNNLSHGRNVAMVFASKNLPSEYMGIKVIDGDLHDLRFLDPAGVIVGLRPKNGAAKKAPNFVKGI
jgi:hypothetical protein